MSSNSSEAGATPLFALSPPTLISISARNILFAPAAIEFSFSAIRTESTESTASNNSTAFAALFVWRCPIKCHSESLRSRRAVAFPENSCTRFSPKTRSPALYASRILSTGKVLLTPISVTSSGLRPTRRAAAAIRSRTSTTFSAIDIREKKLERPSKTQRQDRVGTGDSPVQTLSEFCVVILTSSQPAALAHSDRLHLKAESESSAQPDLPSPRAPPDKKDEQISEVSSNCGPWQPPRCPPKPGPATILRRSALRPSALQHSPSAPSVRD